MLPHLCTSKHADISREMGESLPFLMISNGSVLFNIDLCEHDVG